MNYLGLLKLSLTGSLNQYGEYKAKFYNGEAVRWWSILYWLDCALRCFGYNIATFEPYDARKRINGLDHPATADTMCGTKRLDAIKEQIRYIIKNNIEGDVLVAGVWRGGVGIYAQALLKHFEQRRTIFLADSFAGLPKPTAKQDKGDKLYQVGYLAVSEHAVRNNFIKYRLLAPNIIFLKGWFKDTLPKLPTEKLALIYADGDLYESTMDILNNCYHKLQSGGFIVIDDYNAMPACKVAVDEFRAKNGITEPMIEIDPLAVYWQKR